MVLKTTICRFSGLRIYPGKGILFIRVDGQQYLFLNKKCKSLFNNRLRPAKLAWTASYRKQHKKDQVRTRRGGIRICSRWEAASWGRCDRHLARSQHRVQFKVSR